MDRLEFIRRHRRQYLLLFLEQASHTELLDWLGDIPGLDHALYEFLDGNDRLWQAARTEGKAYRQQ